MAQAAPETIIEPFPIFKLAHRYLLYDIDTVSHVRCEHNICGVLIGSLPQAPQQNVFNGLPMELLPEEARLLVEKRVAYIVDDVARHKRAFLQDGLSVDERRAYQAALRKQGLGAAKEAVKKTDERKKEALKKKAGADNWNDIPEDMFKPKPGRKKKNAKESEQQQKSADASTEDSGETLFASPANSLQAQQSSSEPSASGQSEPDPYAVTPTTSFPPLQSAPSSYTRTYIPDVPPSYPLFKHLHDQGYFLSPGLRFGCQYVAYPGDPLRFHSHFLVNGMDWDQEFDLLDLVGGGRLGTGVKKGFLVGGLEESNQPATNQKGGGTSTDVRAFCVEWGGM